MAADPDELERRLRRLEALFSVLLVAETSDDFPPKEWDRMLRRLLRPPQKEPDFIWDELYFLLRESRFPRRGQLRQRVDELSSRLDEVQNASAEMSKNVSQFHDRLGPIAHLRTSFERTVEKTVPMLRDDVRAVADTQQTLQRELHSYLIAQSLGIDANQLSLHRFVPVHVYLSKDDPKAAQRISTAITNLLDVFGFEVSDDFPPEKSSWFKGWFAKSKETITQPEVANRLKKVERAIELAQLQERQATIDEKQAKATRDIMAAIENTPDAVCLVGSILAVKITNDETPRVYVRSLTPEEMIFLNQNQHLLKSPDTILESLSSCAKAHSHVDGSTVATVESPASDVKSDGE